MVVDLVVRWLGVGRVIERSVVRLPAGALSSQLGKLSLPSIRGKLIDLIEYQPAWLGLGGGRVHLCRVAGNTV